MQSNLKKIIVFDLETGGLNHNYSSITEFAGVVIDLENLEIIDEFSVMIKPYLNLENNDKDTTKEARKIFKELAQKDLDTNIKTLEFKGQKLTLKTLDPLIESLDELYHSNIFGTFYHTFFIEELLKSDYEDIIKIYLDYCYNPQALETTHISKKMLFEKGLDIEDAFKEIIKFLTKHKVGNNKPIAAGHNIEGFDIGFFEKFFEQFDKHFSDYFNDFKIDTLRWARLWKFEMPSYALGVVGNELDITLEDAHRAIADTRVNAKILIKFLKNLRGFGTGEEKYVRRKYNFNF